MMQKQLKLALKNGKRIQFKEYEIKIKLYCITYIWDVVE